jgi:hypothetical protein
MNMRYSHVEDTGIPPSMVLLTNVNTTDPFFDEWGEDPNPFYLWESGNQAIDPGCPVGTLPGRYPGVALRRHREQSSAQLPCLPGERGRLRHPVCELPNLRTPQHPLQLRLQ